MDYVLSYPGRRLSSPTVDVRISHTMFTKGATGNITGLTWVTHTDPENALVGLVAATITELVINRHLVSIRNKSRLP
jgi:hypothetical protein